MFRVRVQPGYVAGNATKEVASELANRLWAAIRERLPDDTLELLHYQDALTCIACDIGTEDALRDPLGTIAGALALLDGLEGRNDEEKGKAAAEGD